MTVMLVVDDSAVMRNVITDMIDGQRASRSLVRQGTARKH